MRSGQPGGGQLRGVTCVSFPGACRVLASGLRWRFRIFFAASCPRRVCRDPQADLPPGRSRTRATGSSGRAAQRGPRGQNRRTGPCGMRRGGQRGHGRQCGGQAPCAAHPTAVDRILGREPCTRSGACRHAKGRPTGGVKGGKAAHGDVKRARRPKIWAAATPGMEPNLLPSRLYNINACMQPIFALTFGKLKYF